MARRFCMACLNDWQPDNACHDDDYEPEDREPDVEMDAQFDRENYDLQGDAL